MFKPKERKDEKKLVSSKDSSHFSKPLNNINCVYKNGVHQRAAIFAGPDTEMGEARMAQLDSAAKKVGSRSHIISFL